MMPLVVGAIRSGTTLLRLMLDSHPEIAMTPETSFPEALFLDAPQASGAEIAQRVVASKKWADLGLDEAAYLAECSRLSGASSLRLVWELYRRRAGKTWVGDKSPGYVACLPSVARSLPGIRVIHVIRDGRDCFASQRSSRFSLYSTRLRPPGQQAGTWVRHVQLGQAAGRSLPAYIEVRYEDLVRDAEPQLRRICAFLGVEYSPEMLRYHERASLRLDELGDRLVDGGKRQTSAVRKDAFSLTRQPPDELRVGRWRETLLPWEVAEYEAAAGALLVGLGYSLAETVLSNRDPPLAESLAAAADACLAERRYGLALRRAIEACRADPQGREFKILLRKVAEWTEDFPVQWATDVALDVKLKRRFESGPAIWCGQPLNEREKLLIWRSHKDLGADLRYSSLLANLHDLAPHCVVEVDHRVVPLIRRRFPDLEVVGKGATPSPSVAYHASWELLAHHLLPARAAMPGTPWLKADPERVINLRRHDPSGTQLPRVALSWHSSNDDKSLPPRETWLPILNVSGVEFVSAQYSEDPHAVLEWGQAGRRVRVEAVDLRDDLDGLGALLCSCDLLITVSASPAHLSGGLGVPTWVLMLEEPKLSWPLGKEESPWYPGTRCVWVRDETAWAAAMARVARELQDWLAEWKPDR